MLEVWVCKEQPSARLVVARGAALPADLGSRDWTLLGPFQGSAEVAREVDRQGYHFFHSTERVPDPADLKDDNAAGA